MNFPLKNLSSNAVFKCLLCNKNDNDFSVINIKRFNDNSIDMTFTRRLESNGLYRSINNETESKFLRAAIE